MREPTATPAIVRSRDHQRKANTSAPLSGGHDVHVVSNQPKKGISNDLISSSVLTLSKALKTRRALRALGLFPNSRSARVLPLRLSRKRVCLILPHGQTRAYSVNVRPASQTVRNTLPNQHVFHAVLDRLHHHRPFKASSSAGFETSWKDLTCEAEQLSPDDKIHD